jgi:hypothetical protein
MALASQVFPPAEDLPIIILDAEPTCCRWFVLKDLKTV